MLWAILLYFVEPPEYGIACNTDDYPYIFIKVLFSLTIQQQQLHTHTHMLVLKYLPVVSYQ